MFYLRCSVVSLNIIAVYFQAQQSHLQFLTLLNASNECNTLIKSRIMSHVIITSMYSGGLEAVVVSFERGGSTFTTVTLSRPLVQYYTARFDKRGGVEIRIYK